MVGELSCAETGSELECAARKRIVNRMSGRLLKTIVRGLDLAATVAPWSRAIRSATHLQTGSRGEEEAYFHLRKLGYVMVARNFRSPRRRGEIDLIGWDGDMLCFIEVKTRTSRAVMPAEGAVDLEKQRDLRIMAREYLRRLGETPPCRFDVLSIYFGKFSTPVDIEIFKNAFPMS
jgi:putative endonuclease